MKVVLLDKGVSWGIRDMEPVGPLSEAEAEALVAEAEGWPSVEKCHVLDLVEVETARTHCASSA